MFFIISKCVISVQFSFRVAQWQLNIHFDFLCLMMCDLNMKASATSSLSASASDSVRVTSAVILSTMQQSLSHSSVHPKQDFDIQQRTTARGAKLSGGKGGQLKVGPTHRVPAGVPATNGEPRISVILLHFTYH